MKVGLQQVFQNHGREVSDGQMVEGKSHWA